jgi:hypothetical protein
MPGLLLSTSDVHWQYRHPAAGRRVLNTLTKSRFKAEGVTHLMQSKHECNAECVATVQDPQQVHHDHVIMSSRSSTKDGAWQG